MNATDVLESLRERGALVRAECGDIVVSARKGVLTEDDRTAIAQVKPQLLDLLATEQRRTYTPLIEYAASILPSIKMTVRETGDVERDFGLVNRIRQVIQEFQPGGNHIYLAIVTLNGRRIVVEWRALADRELRLALGRVLARAGLKGIAS
jgi:hypothetical protein